jgi:hypothetical protein
VTTLRLAREIWRLNNLVSHGKSQGQRKRLVSQEKIQDKRDVARVSLVKSWQDQGKHTSLMSQDKSQDRNFVSHVQQSRSAL